MVSVSTVSIPVPSAQAQRSGEGSGERAAETTTAKASQANEASERLDAALSALRAAPDQAKQAAMNRARERVELVREQLKLIKQLYAEDPKAMAKALRHLVKELKDALKAYKDAGGALSALQGGGRMPAPSAPQTTMSEINPSNSSDQDTLNQDSEAPTESQEQNAADDVGQAKDAEGADDSQAAAPLTPSDAEPVQSGIEALHARQGALKGHETFAQEVTGLTKKIRELFETAKTKAAFMARDKERDTAFETLTEDLGELEEDLFEYTRGVQDDLNAVTLEIKLIERGELSTPALSISV